MIEIIERDDGFWIVQTEMTDLCDEPFASMAEAERGLMFFLNWLASLLFGKEAVEKARRRPVRRRPRHR